MISPFAFGWPGILMTFLDRLFSSDRNDRVKLGIHLVFPLLFLSFPLFDTVRKTLSSHPKQPAFDQVAHSCKIPHLLSFSLLLLIPPLRFAGKENLLSMHSNALSESVKAEFFFFRSYDKIFCILRGPFPQLISRQSIVIFSAPVVSLTFSSLRE